MALSFLLPKNRIINLIINDHSIRYIELKQTKPPQASKYGERILPAGIVKDGKIIDHQTLSFILEECINEWKIQKRQVRFLVPDAFVIIRKVLIPAEVKDDEIQGHLYIELGSSIHLPFEEPVFDAFVLNEKDGKKEIVIFAAPEQNVMEYADLFTDLKLKPIAADISPLALYRLYYHLGFEEVQESLLMVQLDISMVNICIFENHVPFFMHHVPVETDEDKWERVLNQNGVHELHYRGNFEDLIEHYDDVFREINRLMDFYRYSINQGVKQVSKILLNGDHPMLSYILTEMEKRYDVPAKIISLSSQPDELLPQSHYLALGLALKEV